MTVCVFVFALLLLFTLILYDTQKQEPVIKGQALPDYNELMLHNAKVAHKLLPFSFVWRIISFIMFC